MGDDLDKWGGGRFDVVSWDPRGTNASTRVLCFHNQRDEAIFWAGVSFPSTNAESERFARKSADLARRCGEVSGWLLPHISTADTARDLDHLRVLMGEEKLTYFGFSYGTYLGQTYANMFPDRIRAMLLSGLVDPTEYSKNAEARTTRLVASTDEVYDQFLSLCEGAGPERCALAGGDQTAAERFKRLSERLKRAPIPAPGASPPLLSPQELTYGDMLLSQGAAAQFPGTWPENAANLAAALRGDGSGLESAAAAFKQPAGWARLTTEAAISCADAPAQRSLSAWPQVIRRFENVSRLKGFIGWAVWAPCAAWPVRGEDEYRGPWTVTTPNPILLLSKRYDPNTGYANAVHVEQLLGNAVLLTVDGYGHDPDPLSACAEQAFADYLVHLITPPKGTFCESNHKPFDPDFGKPPNQE
jgi:pimeloyl-ACP methyl ester carboxylesterase